VGGTAVKAASTDQLLEQLGTAADEAAQALACRDRMIVDAVRAGLSRRAVARACGMTHPGISKIVARVDIAEQAAAS
jgi:hypothetical protein